MGDKGGISYKGWERGEWGDKWFHEERTACARVWEHLRTMECSASPVLRRLRASLETVTCRKPDFRRQCLAESSAEHLTL